MTSPNESVLSRRAFAAFAGVGFFSPVLATLQPSASGGVAAQADVPDPDLTTLEVPERVAPGESFSVHVEFTNVGAQTGPWSSISLSFPTLDEPDDGDRLSIVDEDLLGYSGIVTAGQEVTDSSGNRITAEYALVEVGYAEEGKWDAGATHFVTVRVTPEDTGDFPVLMRATLTAPGDVDTKYSYPEFSSTTDQQGFDAYQRTVRVEEGTAAETTREPPAGVDEQPPGTVHRGFVSNDPGGGRFGAVSGADSITVLSILVTVVSMGLSIVQMSRGR